MGDNYRKSYDRSSYNTDERRKNVPEAEINKGGEELVKKIYEWVSVQPLKYDE